MHAHITHPTETRSVLSLAGIAVGLLCRSKGQLERLYEMWRQFFYFEGTSAEPAVRFTFTHTQTVKPAGEAVYQSDTLLVVKTERGFILACGAAWLELDVAASRAIGALPESFWHLTPYDQREFFLLSLLMLLRPHGLYGLHANGLVLGGRGLLIVGPSGSGKTTLTLSLLKQGWQFVSDDAVLLKDGEGLHVYAFRRGFSFTSQTEAFFATNKANAMYHAQDKRVLAAEQLFPGQFTPRLSPRLLVFPELSYAPQSELAELKPSEALILLVQQSAGSMVDKALASRQLELLKRLVQSSACYHLRAGTDVVRQGERVSAKLKPLLDTYG